MFLSTFGQIDGCEFKQISENQLTLESKAYLLPMHYMKVVKN